jgi:hypothetical protein
MVGQSSGFLRNRGFKRQLASLHYIWDKWQFCTDVVKRKGRTNSLRRLHAGWHGNVDLRWFRSKFSVDRKQQLLSACGRIFATVSHESLWRSNHI